MTRGNQFFVNKVYILYILLRSGLGSLGQVGRKWVELSTHLI